MTQLGWWEVVVKNNIGLSSFKRMNETKIGGPKGEQHGSLHLRPK